MTKAAKRRVRTEMTTEQLATKAAKDVKRMSPDEKAKLRTRLRREFGTADAAEEAALNYDGNGKPVN
jgi:hypothetical protein